MSPDSGGREGGPLLITIEPSAGDAAMAAFIAWAGSEADVRLSYTPDVLLAINTSERRGWLNDEVYFVTVWVERGAAAFRSHLESTVPADRWSEKAPDGEPDPIALLSVAIESGQPIEVAGEQRSIQERSDAGPTAPGD